MTMVRALSWAVRVPEASAPWDTVHLRAYYPAAPRGDLAERMSGILAADLSSGPRPVVIVVPGINCPPESYRWLAEELVGAGFIAVTYALIGPLMPGQIGITPGLEIDRLRPEVIGQQTPAVAMLPLLDALRELNEQAPLNGLIDLDSVALIGHSAGGSVALHLTRKDWCPGIKAVITYGAHGLASMHLGYGPGHLFPLAGEVPVLLLAGERDGVMEASALRYGEETGERADPIERTFEQLAGHDHHYVVLEGTNHLSLLHPEDATMARGFLDHPTTGDDAARRAAIVELVTDFLVATTGDATAREAATHRMAGWAQRPEVLASRVH